MCTLVEAGRKGLKGDHHLLRTYTLDKQAPDSQ